MLKPCSHVKALIVNLKYLKGIHIQIIKGESFQYRDGIKDFNQFLNHINNIQICVIFRVGKDTISSSQDMKVISEF